MKKTRIGFGVLIGLCISVSSLCAAETAVRPVTPGATPEAVELLNFFYRISGKQTLTGQHNFPGDKDKHTLAAAKAWGKTPAIFGKDWGFAKEGDKDSAYIRSEIVAQLIEQYKKGSLVVMCWHEVPPTADEPVTFRRPRRGGTAINLHSVQGQLTEAQYKDLLTPGTKLHEHWCAQVDAIVPYLKKLEEAHVPLLWRPFHEMNGTWFWWGGRRGEYGTGAIYKMMFDRLVKYHKIRNLIWIWNCDRPEGTSLKLEECWPGPEYADILALDCYSIFKQSYYDDMVKLADGKPVALGEVGGNLNLAAIKSQPKWVFWMEWAGSGVRGNVGKNLTEMVKEPRYWSLSDPEYRKAIAPVRIASGLPAEPPAP
ncbi:MAG: glycoside hydrolase family 26 protein [Thermoguttaceae bacterium]